jgi:hypothetical protein
VNALATLQDEPLSEGIGLEQREQTESGQMLVAIIRGAAVEPVTVAAV